MSARLRTAGVREISNNLSVCLNKKSRFVMEKIQVEVLRDEDNNKGDKNCKLMFLVMSSEKFIDLIDFVSSSW